MNACKECCGIGCLIFGLAFATALSAQETLTWSTSSSGHFAGGCNRDAESAKSAAVAGTSKAARPAIVFKGRLGRDELYAVDALQGLVNRSGPLLFQRNGRSWNDQWVAIYVRDYGLEFREIDRLDQLLLEFRAMIRGLVIYDPAVDGGRCVAMTLAGVDDLLPVDAEMLEGRSRGLKGADLKRLLDVPIRYDLRGKFHTSVEAYQWALKEVMPRCNRSFAHSPSGPDVDGLHIGMGPFRGFDWVVMQRGFVFNLALNYQDTQSFGHPVAGDRAQADMYRTILAALEKPAVIFGYGEFEWDWFTLVGQYGHQYLHWGDNLSFHQQVPLRSKHAPPQAPVAVKLDPAKYYVCFLTSEGDSMKGPIPFFFGSWMDPARGSVPINWALPPLIVKFPAMLDYYRSTATAADCLVPFEIVNFAMPNLGQLAASRAPMLREADMKHIALASRKVDLGRLEQYVRASGVQGVAVIEWQHNAAPAKTEFLPDGGPVITSAGKLGYWQSKIYGWGHQWAEICREEAGRAATVTKVVANIEQAAKGHQPPFVILVYGDIHDYDRLCLLHSEIAKALDGRFQAARLDDAMAAIRLYHSMCR